MQINADFPYFCGIFITDKTGKLGATGRPLHTDIHSKTISIVNSIAVYQNIQHQALLPAHLNAFTATSTLFS